MKLRVQDSAGAEKDLQQVLSFRPDSAEAHFEFARVKHMENFTAGARQELTQALNLNPHYLSARVALAWNLINTGQPKGALELLDQTPPSQKNDISVLINRNWALLALGDLKQAREGIDKGLKSGRFPDLVEQDGFLKIKEGQFAGAQADAEEILKAYPEQEPHNVRAVRLLVDSCIAQHQKSHAVEVLGGIAAQRPKSAQLQNLLGMLLEEFGDPAGARKAFEAALAAEPGFLPSKLELAAIDLAENRSDAARQALNSILASYPRNVNALLMLADVEANAGNRPTAIAKYRAALAIDRGNIRALKSLANMVIQDSPGEAVSFAQQAVELAPKDPSAQDTLGRAFYRNGVYGQAAEHLKRAVELEPTPSRQYHLALSYMKGGQDSLGRPLLAAALQKDPELPQKDRGW
jgi:cellulose synthase operon protein C